MALLFWDGFDNYSTAFEVISARPDVKVTWDINNSTYGWSPQSSFWTTTGGRFGGCATKSPGYPSDDSWGFIDLQGAYTELYIGKAIYMTGVNNGIHCFWGNQNSIAAHNKAFAPDVWLELYNNVLQVRNGVGATWTNSTRQSGGTILAQSASYVMRTSVWNWIEMRVKMSSSNTTNDGIVQVWLNNNLVASNTACITRVSNLSTGYMGTNFNAGCTTQGGIYYDNAYADDMYISDTTGSAPWNGRLGDSRIITLVPTADSGPNTGTPTTGTTHWGVVDEKPYNTSDYLKIPVGPGDNREVFVKSSLLSINSTISAVGVNYLVQKSDVGAANIKSILVNNSSGYVANANSISPTTNFAYYHDTFVTDPSSNTQWTYANVANLLVGVIVSP